MARHTDWLRQWAWRAALSSGGVLAVIPSMAAPPQAPVEQRDLDPGVAKHASAARGEVIQERYPSRALKVERHVAQDSDGNYANHGPWTMWDEQGQVVASGTFRRGLRHGKWTRHYKGGDAELISGPAAAAFQAPFVSEATFLDGQLHGTWTIYDAQERTVLCWNFDHGVREGKCTWYFGDGQKWRELDYRNGELDGLLVEWNVTGDVVAEESYVQGRRSGLKTEYYAPGSKRVEANFLFAKDIIQTNDDWWAGSSRSTLVKKQGKDERHGLWTTYYRNGQKALEGQYKNDVPTGTFTWWHPNGQKAIEGPYTAGKQSGQWAWWYPNGQRHIRGFYDRGQQAGQWSWWTDEGTFAEGASFSVASAEPRTAPKLETVESPPQLQPADDAELDVPETAGRERTLR